jgi:hypothetical protein
MMLISFSYPGESENALSQHDVNRDVSALVLQLETIVSLLNNVSSGTIRARLPFQNQLSENKGLAIFFPLHHNTSEILSWSRRQF